MGQELLNESMSAVMDGEAAELELRRVLSACGEDAELRQRWKRHQLASAALRGQLVRPELDLAARVSAALAAEEAAPGASARGAGRGSQLLRLSVAASVTFAVLVGARFYGMQQAPLEAGLASQGAVPTINVLARPAAELQGPAVLASYPAPAGMLLQSPLMQPPQAKEQGDILRRLPVEPRQ